MIKAPALALGATIALFATSVFADELADGVATIPGSVEDVRIGGTWQSEGKSGVYRIVIARTGGNAVTARIFVQRIAYGDAGASTVEHSREITEFDDLDLDIVDFMSESDADGLSVYIEAINPESGADEQFELFVFGQDDDYRFGTASN